MASEPIQGIRYPLPSDQADGPTQIKNLADDVVTLTNMRFASAGARDAALPSPSEGMEAFIGAGQTAEKLIFAGGWQRMWSDSGWQTVPWNSGYTTYGGVSAQYKRVGNHIQLRGLVKPNSGAFATGTGHNVLSIPTSLTPSFFDFQLTTDEQGRAHTLQIQPDGQVVLVARSAGAEWMSITYSWLL